MSTPYRHLSRLAFGVAVAALAAPACTTPEPPPGTTPTTVTPTTGAPGTTATTAPNPGGPVTVAADGSARFRTVQAAVDALPSGSRITIARGTYRGTVRIPAGKAGLTLAGATGNAADVVLTEARNAQTAGSNEASSTVVNASAGSTIADLTIANTFNEASTATNQDQAVALTARNDRQVYRNVRLLGNQDTLLTTTGSNTVRYRQLFTRSFIEGDVDFIFGNGTAVFDGCEIHSVTRSSGTVMAPATYNTNPYGFLFVNSRFTSGAAANSMHLGRPWHPGNDPNADGQAVVRNSTIGAHIRAAQPWTDMSGFSWRTEGRFAEYQNTGPGAGVNGNRPQLSAAQAGTYTRQRYLAGTDGWNPAD
jgi:pectinesterase